MSKKVGTPEPILCLQVETPPEIAIGKCKTVLATFVLQNWPTFFAPQVWTVKNYHAKTKKWIHHLLVMLIGDSSKKELFANVCCLSSIWMWSKARWRLIAKELFTQKLKNPMSKEPIAILRHGSCTEIAVAENSGLFKCACVAIIVPWERSKSGPNSAEHSRICWMQAPRLTKSLSIFCPCNLPAKRQH